MVFDVSNALTSIDFLKHGYINYNHHACDRPIDQFRNTISEILRSKVSDFSFFAKLKRFLTHRQFFLSYVLCKGADRDYRVLLLLLLLLLLQVKPGNNIL